MLPICYTLPYENAMIPKETLANILHDELKPTLGCTDPAAIALCACGAMYAARLVHEENLVSVSVTLDTHLYKNAHSARIVKTDLKGIEAALSLGLSIEDISLGLRVFDAIGDSVLRKADVLRKKVPIHVNVDWSQPDVYDLTEITFESGAVASALIKTSHDHFEFMKCGEYEKHSPTIAVPRFADALEPYVSDEFPDLLGESILTLSSEDLCIIRDALRINNESLSGFYPDFLGIGKLGKISSSSNPIQRARRLVMMVTEARMRGEQVPIIACGGSGNHGITVFVAMQNIWNALPIVAGRDLEHACAYSVGMLHVFKQHTGILTSICGCAFSSALAISAACVWGMGGKSGQVLQAMNIIVSSLGGISCDGAKPGCAYKTGMAVQVAIEAAFLSMDDVTISSDDGLACCGFASFMKMITLTHKEAMESFEPAMVKFLLQKEKS